MKTNSRRATAILRYLIPLAVLLLLSPLTARADVWTLADWSAIIDGSTFNPPALPGSVNSKGFDFSTGLGALVFSFSTAGNHYAGVYLSPYLDTGFGDVSDAYAAAVGTAPSGTLSVTYQFGWPGVGIPSVFDNFASNALDGSNTVAAYVPPTSACCTVAMAEIGAFTLASGDTATLTFNVNINPPASGFYLQETDHDSGDIIYLTNSLVVNSSGSIPEPSALLLLATACGGAFCLTRGRRS